MDRKVLPKGTDLIVSLADTYSIWKNTEEYVHLKYPSAMGEWSYSGDRYGWSFRIKDKKRTIIYLLPRVSFFKVALVFGQKATNAILASGISDMIKSELVAARVYAEGRGIRINIRDESVLEDIMKLIDFKIAY